MVEPRPAAAEDPDFPAPPVPAPVPVLVSADPPDYSGAIPGFEMLPDRPPQGLIRRFITTQRHLIALAFGALVAHARAGQALGSGRRFRFLFWLERLLAALILT